MNPQQRQIIAYLVSTTLVALYYTYFVLTHSGLEGTEYETISSSWGKFILIIIAVNVGLSILVSILVTVLNSVINKRGDEPCEEPIMEDERDKQIDLKANKISYGIFGGGFLLAMIVLALGQPPLLMFHIIVFSILGAGIGGNLLQLYLYRRGF